MLAEERWNAILELVDQQKTVTVQDLTTMLNTSESTIRRDLTELDHRKKLVKVHGGATCIDTRYVLSDQSLSEKYKMNSSEKQVIAEYAASLISPDDFVYIDAGTTTDRLVEAVSETRAIYVTNSIAHARKLLAKGCRVILPGGEVKPLTEAMVGPDAVENIRKYHFTIGFWGANGVTESAGFTTPEPNEAMVKRMSMKQTKNRYVLCDASKFDLISPVSFADFHDALIITDTVPNVHYKKYNHIVEVKKR